MGCTCNSKTVACRAKQTEIWDWGTQIIIYIYTSFDPAVFKVILGSFGAMACNRNWLVVGRNWLKFETREQVSNKVKWINKNFLWEFPFLSAIYLLFLNYLIFLILTFLFSFLFTWDLIGPKIVKRYRYVIGKHPGHCNNCLKYGYPINLGLNDIYR